MIDGFEYWFTSWDLENNRWSMNPLIDSDQWLDSDQDSVTVTRWQYFMMSNLPIRENMNPGFTEYGQRLSTGSGLIGFGDDAIDAYVEEGSTELEEKVIFNTFRNKDSLSLARMELINDADSETFNRTLLE